MLNIGIYGNNGRSGTVRAAINAQIGKAQVYGYYNADNRSTANLNPNYINYATYEDMLADENIDAVAITNGYCMHADYVIQALNAGKHVWCEITAGVTPQQCVELCEAAEHSGKIFALAENYSQLPTVLRIKEEIDSGKMGQIAYAEGEYCHVLDIGETNIYQRNTPYHWRLYRPCTFYSEHALGPLMYMLNTIPTSVFAKAAKGSKEFQQQHNFHYQEIAGTMLIETDCGILFYVKGCTHWPGDGRYYRVNGEYGCIEIPRGHGYDLRLVYSSDRLMQCGGSTLEYPANKTIAKVAYPEEIANFISQANVHVPHQGSDLLLAKNFVDAIEGKCEPYFDVYKACAMSAVSIYGWRSILEGKEFKIPDFKDPAQRELIRNDDLNPFSINGSTPTLPCTK